MNNVYRLEITDGTTTVSLMDGSDGFYEARWVPSIPEYKGGGTFQETPLTQGRRLVDKQFTNIIETITVVLSTNTVDGAQVAKQKVRRLLEKAADYWVNEWTDTPVYLIAQSKEETNPRYAVISNGRVPDGGDPYGTNYAYSFGGRKYTHEEIDIIIEHGLWMSSAPGDAQELCTFNGGFYNGIQYGTDSSPITVIDYAIFYDDSGGTYTANLANGPFPIDFVPILSTAGDLLYIGVDNVRFNWLYFSLSSGQDGTSGTEWDYWDGGQWVEFTADLLKDTTGTAGASGQFSLQQSGFITWDPIPDWQKAAVNGTLAYWVRMRLNGTPFVAAATADTYASYSSSNEDALCLTAEAPYVANKYNRANVTDIYYNDGSFSSNLIEGIIPYDLANLAATDIYFGIDTSLGNSGHFNSLIFDLDAGVYGGGVTAAWEYWTGATWAALSTFQDNTNELQEAGVVGIFWNSPSNWATTAVNGVTGYWVRLHLTGGNFSTVPTQNNRHVYSVTWPYLEVSSTALEGDILALIKQIVTAKSANTTIVTMTPTAAAIVGRRSVSRDGNTAGTGYEFVSHINMADEQNNDGVTVAIGSFGSASFVSSVTVPSGRRISVASGATYADQEIAVVTLATTVAGIYQGQYHLYARGEIGGTGAAGDIKIRVKIQNTTYGLTTYSEWGYPYATFSGVPTDLGKVTIQGYVPGATYPYGVVTLTVYATSTLAGASLTLTDLILIPSDEWIQYIDYNTYLVNGYSGVYDSTAGKRGMTVYSEAEPGYLDAIGFSRGSVPATAPPNEASRYWFLFVAPAAYSPYYICNRVETHGIQRYISMRGDR